MGMLLYMPSNAILPWAEENQGMATLITLLVAVGIFLFEQRRANKAEQRSRDEARGQEAKRWAWERETYNARLTDYVLTVADLINFALQLINETQNELVGRDSHWTTPVARAAIWRAQADSLLALLPSCPSDSRLIMFSVQTRSILTGLSNDGPLSGPAARHWLKAQHHALTSALEGLRMRERELHRQETV